jgi:NAD(P)-dependent dehydrogenase (short-subunit alcohol dehydrogenase family)
MSDSVKQVRALGLTGLSALITGGASGLGASIARLLGQRGAKILLFDLSSAGLARTAAELTSAGIDVATRIGDVSDSASCDEAASWADELSGGLDILVNSAGIGGRNAMSWELTDEEWRAVLFVNLDGVFYMTRAVVPQMRRRGWGRIVNISSMAGKEGNPSSSHYSASKAGVIGFTKSVGKELARDGILVNAIAPSVIDTAILKTQSPEHIASLVAKVPMGRLGTADEVSRLVGFLVSHEMTFSTGAVFDLSGGRATY